ncbi:MAG: isochorismatase family protein [Candidatus Latescibacteria bacterium]|jgi:isochorismate hydrolase|nr:isochorismatase family protein [Candidatus Latescibacterota bacterium]
MKSSYFSCETIGDKSLEMLEKLAKYRKTRRINFIPDQSALLVLDMQRYFLDECSHAYIPSALSIIPKIKNLAKAYIKINTPVILTRHINSNKDAGLMAQWWDDIITEKDDLSGIISELNLPGAIVIKKTQYDGFYRTPLKDMLREKGVSQLVITGVMSHLCCETTARSAFVKGFEVFFPVDGTATYNEDFHLATLINLSHGFAVPMLMEELQNCVEASQVGQ